MGTRTNVESVPSIRPDHANAAWDATLRKAESGDTAALRDVVRQTDDSPNRDQVWTLIGDVGARAERRWIERLGGDNAVVKVAIRRVVERMRAELAGADPPPLEALLVSRIIACWLQTQEADITCLVLEDHYFALGDYHQRRQERAHRRYLAAIRSLAVVRRLFTLPIQLMMNVERQINVGREVRTCGTPSKRATNEGA